MEWSWNSRKWDSEESSKVSIFELACEWGEDILGNSEEGSAAWTLKLVFRVSRSKGSMWKTRGSSKNIGEFSRQKDKGISMNSVGTPFSGMGEI